MREVRAVEEMFRNKFLVQEPSPAPPQELEALRQRLRRQIAHDLDIPDDEDGLVRLPDNVVLSTRADAIFEEFIDKVAHV